MTEYKFEYTCEVKHGVYSDYFSYEFEEEFEDDFAAVGYAFLRAAIYEELDIKVTSIYVFEKSHCNNVLLNIG